MVRRRRGAGERVADGEREELERAAAGEWAVVEEVKQSSLRRARVPPVWGGHGGGGEGRGRRGIAGGGRHRRDGWLAMAVSSCAGAGIAQTVGGGMKWAKPIGLVHHSEGVHHASYASFSFVRSCNHLGRFYTGLVYFSKRKILRHCSTFVCLW